MNYPQKIKSLFTGPAARRNGLFAILAALMAIAAPELVLAASTGAEFADAYTKILEWATGSLGKLVSLTFLVVGIVMGVMQQSIFAAVPAIACALAMSVGPTVIDSILTAAL